MFRVFGIPGCRDRLTCNALARPGGRLTVMTGNTANCEGSVTGAADRIDQPRLAGYRMSGSALSRHPGPPQSQRPERRLGARLLGLPEPLAIPATAEQAAAPPVCLCIASTGRDRPHLPRSAPGLAPPEPCPAGHARATRQGNSPTGSGHSRALDARCQSAAAMGSREDVTATGCRGKPVSPGAGWSRPPGWGRAAAGGGRIWRWRRGPSWRWCRCTPSSRVRGGRRSALPGR
jgi:hypothetical protein